MRTLFFWVSIITCLVVLGMGAVWKESLWSFLIIGPICLIGWYDMLQKKHAIRRNFPVLGHFRYMLEGIRPEIMQYFVETDTEGKPFNRLNRSLVYRRSKNVSDKTPFGTQFDTYSEGYEWVGHSIYPTDPKEIRKKLKVTIGEGNCKHPYECSVLNVSAMSFGSLSDRAVLALNGGAKIGGFAHNTGEGGVSPYHLKHGGDLIWQIGTGYFGCRAEDGGFSRERYEETVAHPNVKMIELKLSQGAKPGHGGILPASKNTKEIAKIRGVEPHKDVDSPPYHKAFTNAEEMMQFISNLREWSGGKPVGFKLCVGRAEEFVDICRAIQKTGFYPDFIAVDGGEGGTGAAPVEFSDSVGMPMRDGLAFVHDMLTGFGLRDKIKLAASGKITTGFDMLRAIALGADFCYSARAMMMSLGCIQALQCNSNNCPVGIATQDRELINGLVVKDKEQRVANFHYKTVRSLAQLMGSAGMNDMTSVKRKLILRRTAVNMVESYEQIYPSIEFGSFINGVIPKHFESFLVPEETLVS